jgi:ApbE superfamily uncharacterized protein (UPF0280 family)
LQHGPIDLIIDATGRQDDVSKSYRQAGCAFASVLDVLSAQLQLLRQTLLDSTQGSLFRGAVATRMFSAAEPFRHMLVTPMIAVAGAVADHILDAMLAGRELDRILVNNGGDIALHLSAGTSCRIGICTSTASARYSDVVTLDADAGIGGVATSGWQGRSHSLGIADAVTVLACNAASADAAATLIANAIDLPVSGKVTRVPACSLSPDSDLGDRPVTIAVDDLSTVEKTEALRAGCTFAEQLQAQGLIVSAYMNLQGQSCVVGTRFYDVKLTTASTGT